MSRAAKDSVFDALEDLPDTVTTGDIAVWLVIADRQNDRSGFAWCSCADIALRTHLTLDWVPHAIANLEAHGLLYVERRRGRTNRYRVIHNHRAERGGIEHMTAALSAVGTAVSAVPHRAERGRNQLENQLMNLPTSSVDSHGCGHRWVTVDGDCPSCMAEVC